MLKAKGKPAYSVVIAQQFDDAQAWPKNWEACNSDNYKLIQIVDHLILTSYPRNIRIMLNRFHIEHGSYSVKLTKCTILSDRSVNKHRNERTRLSETTPQIFRIEC